MQSISPCGQMRSRVCVQSIVGGARPASAVDGSIPARTRAKLNLGDLMIWDADRPYHYARWSRGRLIMGGGDRPQLTERQRARAFEESTRDVRRHFQYLLPALADVEAEYAWEGLF